MVRLLDDSGGADSPEVSHFTFERPAIQNQLDYASEYNVAAPGGLYLARQQNCTAAVIALPSIRSFDDLRISVHIDTRDRTPDEVIRAIELACFWGSAKSSGDILTLMHQHSVLCAISRQILQLIGGDRWAAAERDVENSDNYNIEILSKAVSRRQEEDGIAEALVNETAQLAEATLSVRINRLIKCAKKYRLLPPDTPDGNESDSTTWLTELALRLASNPIGVVTWAGLHLRPGITHLLEAPTLVRAARLLVIATDHYLESHTAPGELFAGWDWL
ncbi:hypothetical protein ACFL3H_07045 [Gemmatimonadota bacterium]